MDDAKLDELLVQARAAPPSVPERLAARVIADAAAVQPARGLWPMLSEMLGGLPGLGGLVTATCVGIWLGIAPPENLPDLTGEILGFETVTDEDLEVVDLTGFGWDIGES
jgi:hypothetical protein